MLQSVEWGEYKLGDLFEVKSYKKRFDSNKVDVLEHGEYPYVVRQSTNNGQKGYINADVKYLNAGNTISFGQDTATVFYQEKDYFTGDKIKILKPQLSRFSKSNAQFFLVSMRLAFQKFSWGNSRFNIDTIKKQILKLPVKNGSIDFEFMETFIAELEAQRIAELEAYLTAAGLKDYELTAEEEEALKKLETVEWKEYNLKALYGSSTRGKRLKSSDRIPGNLPFVTAGEADEGISDFIGNHVHVFKKNTTTIDMFGSAKYRNYDYGGDDHVAVVHTENVPQMAAIFVTTAIHKASHCGQFDYSRNFYAKDADALNILLPQVNGDVDYAFMQTFISAIQKLVIKDVVAYSDRKMAATKQAAGM